VIAQPEKWPCSWVSQSGQQEQEILQKVSSHLSHSPAEGQGVRMRTQRACETCAPSYIWLCDGKESLIRKVLEINLLCWSQGLDLMIHVGPFQLGIFCVTKLTSRSECSEQPFQWYILPVMPVTKWIYEVKAKQQGSQKLGLWWKRFSSGWVLSSAQRWRFAVSCCCTHRA